MSTVAHGGEHVRLAGQDRYGTAAAVSRDAFPNGSVPVVHVVNGLGFADALAAGPAAAVLGGPVLPVATDTIPGVIAAELERLRPGRIVLVGGAAAVSSEVEQALGQYTGGGVTRAAGADRYETAAAVALAAFDGPAPQVLLATGEGFADALAARSARTPEPSRTLF
ncbi:MAG: cell wall-binding repeat-containing protein [Frankiaceae bacterium]|nr:cell wall-binding repeat-containing protein [Frankiaceae bacterium]